MKEKKPKDEILELIEIIGTCNRKKNTLDFITQVNNFFISGGAFPFIYIFNFLYTKIETINTPNWIYNVFLYTPNSNNSYDNKKKDLVFGSKNVIFCLTIDSKNKINFGRY